MARSAKDNQGSAFQAFPKGGEIVRLDLADGVWTEFSPAEADDLWHLYVETPAAGRVVYTSGATFPELVDGTAVTGVHLLRSLPVTSTERHECYDRSVSAGVPSARFFFALTGAAGGTGAILFERAAR